MKNIDFNLLVRYAFDELSENESDEIEIYLESHPEDADIVDGILQFALMHNIRTHAEFEQAWSPIEAKGKDDIQAQIRAVRSTRNWDWTKYAVGVAAGLVLGLLWSREQMGSIDKASEVKSDSMEQVVEMWKGQWDSLEITLKLKQLKLDSLAKVKINSSSNRYTTTLTEQERKYLLRQFWMAEGESFKQAGGSSKLWRQQLVSSPSTNPDFEASRRILLDTPESQLDMEDRYYLGVFVLLTNPVNPDMALHFLEGNTHNRPTKHFIALAKALQIPLK